MSTNWGSKEFMQMVEQTPQSAPALDDSTRLDFERTRTAYEGTMMSWIRTSTSLITFGFSIYKFFQIEAPSEKQQNYLVGPCGFALALVGIGLFSLLLATIENRRNIRALGAQYASKRRSLSVLVAALISILGILALLAMIFRE